MKANDQIRIMLEFGSILNACKFNATDRGTKAAYRYGIEVFIPVEERYDFIRKLMELWKFDYMDTLQHELEKPYDYYGYITDDIALFRIFQSLSETND